MTGTRRRRRALGRNESGTKPGLAPLSNSNRLSLAASALLLLVGTTTTRTAHAVEVDEFVLDEELAEFCLGPNPVEDAGPECFPMEAIPYVAVNPLLEADMDLTDLGKVCLEVVEDRHGNMELEVNFQAGKGWTMKDAHFWVGDSVSSAPKTLVYEDTATETAVYEIPQAQDFPYFTKLATLKDPALRTSTHWNEELDAKHVMCKKEHETTGMRAFAGQAVLQRLDDPEAIVTAFVAMQPKDKFKKLEDFFVVCACPDATVVEAEQEGSGEEGGLSLLELIDAERAGGETKMETIMAPEDNSEVTEAEQELESTLEKEEKEEEEVKKELDQELEAALEETEKEVEEVQEKQQELEQEKQQELEQKEAQAAAKEVEETPLTDPAQLAGALVENPLNPIPQTPAEIASNATQPQDVPAEPEENPAEPVQVEGSPVEDPPETTTAEEAQVPAEEEEGEPQEQDFDSVQVGTVEAHSSDNGDSESESGSESGSYSSESESESSSESSDESESESGSESSDENHEEGPVVMVKADELELTTSFIVVMPDQKHYIDMLLDEDTMHKTEEQIEASPELHEAWHKFVAQLMSDFNIPAINASVAVNHARNRYLKEVSVEWIEDSPDLFKFLITTPCPPHVMETARRGVEFGSSPKALIRGNIDEASSKATCYKAFGKYKVLHLNPDSDILEHGEDADYNPSGQSRQEVCYDIFHMTRGALKKEKLGKDLPEDVPFLIQGGKPESCLPTGVSTMVAKPDDIETIEPTMESMDYASQHENSILYELRNEDGTWNALRVMELVAYLSTSLLMMALCITIYCFFLPKIDLESRNRVTDDWSHPSLRPQTVSVRQPSKGRSEPDYFPWLE